MTYRNYLFFLTFIAIFFTSCVSKKKFLEMQDGRLKAEEQVRQLTEETNARAARIKVMIHDFEVMKNELMESNAEKDQYVDELNREIAGLKDKLNQQVESIQERNFAFGFERDRLSETLEERERNIRSLEARIDEQEEEISRQSSVLSDRNIRIGTLNDQLSLLEAEKVRSRQQYEELQQDLQDSRAEVNALKEQIKEKDETITRLQNNVNLLKRELGKSN
jgi:chromosome segregation ATPase